MAVGITQLHIFRLMLQCERNLGNMQRDMVRNATAWKVSAQAQDVPLATLAALMNSAASQYQIRLGQLATLQADTTNWNKVKNMFIALGGSAADFSAMINPLTAVANQLGPADKTTYAAIIADCDQITAAIESPINLWPE